MSLYDHALSTPQIQAIYNAQSAGKCAGSAPAITSQPQTQTVAGGGSVTFSVIATGSTPLSYQWYHNSALVGSASVLNLSGVHSGDAGDYKVVVSNPYGSATSLTATLTVQEVATPTFNPVGGSYTTARNVIISCATAGAVIHYTTDGSDPSESSPSIASGSSVAVDHNLTLKTKAWKSGWSPSDIESESYLIGGTPGQSPTVAITPQQALHLWRLTISRF